MVVLSFVYLVLLLFFFSFVKTHAKKIKKKATFLSSLFSIGSVQYRYFWRKKP